MLSEREFAELCIATICCAICMVMAYVALFLWIIPWLLAKFDPEGARLWAISSLWVGL